MKRNILQIFRSIVTVVVVGTMAAMIFSLRKENTMLRTRIASECAAAKPGPGNCAAETGKEVYVLCKVDLKPDADIASYIAKTHAVFPSVRAEKGCRLYSLFKDADTDWDRPQRFGERTFWMIEKWDSIDALKAHIQAPHMKAFGPSVAPLRQSSTFHVLEEVRP